MILYLKKYKISTQPTLCIPINFLHLNKYRMTSFILSDDYTQEELHKINEDLEDIKDGICKLAELYDEKLNGKQFSCSTEGDVILLCNRLQKDCNITDKTLASVCDISTTILKDWKSGKSHSNSNWRTVLSTFKKIYMELIEEFKGEFGEHEEVHTAETDYLL